MACVSPTHYKPSFAAGLYRLRVVNEKARAARGTRSPCNCRSLAYRGVMIVLTLAAGLKIEFLGAACAAPWPCTCRPSSRSRRPTPNWAIHTRLTGLGDEQYIASSSIRSVCLVLDSLVDLFPWAYAQPRSRYGDRLRGFRQWRFNMPRAPKSDGGGATRQRRGMGSAARQQRPLPLLGALPRLRANHKACVSSA